MSEGKIINVYQGAQYVEHIDSQTNNYNYYGTQGASSSTAPDDEDVHMAIGKLYDEVDEDGNRIFSDQGQWYAVYRVLSAYCNYPDKMTDFVRLINGKKWAEKEPLCRYDSIKSINTNLPLLSVKVSLWQQYKNVNEKYEKQCIIAEKLMTLLGVL